MGVLRTVGIDEIIKRGSVKDVDVLRLRAAFYHDSTITPDETEFLFSVNDCCPVQDPSWPVFFVEALTDYVVNQAEPEGYVTAENADWLIKRISKDGRVETRTELDLLVNVLDKSRWSPASLVAFALAQVKDAVVNGDGPLRSGGVLTRGEIGEAEVELLRSMLYAFGGDGNVAITRAEAEMLLDINDATASSPSNPAWTDLFVKALANVLMAASGYSVPTREEALRREAWLERRGDLSPFAVARDVTQHSLASVLGAYREQSPEERALARLERQRIEIITNEEITESEAEWLSERLGRDGKLTANEQALLTFLKRECPRLHPALGRLLARASAAA